MSEISSRGNTMANKSNFLLIVAISLVGTSALAFYFLSSARSVADVVDDIQVTVPKSCTMASLETPVDGAVVHSATVQSDSVTPNIGTTTLRVFCNDADGFAVYAIGYSNDEYGNNKMLATVGGVLNPTYNINTGTNTTGNSSWAMKLTKVTDSTAYESGRLTINNNYDSYHSVPNAWEKVATYHANTGTSATDNVLGSKLTTTYQAYVSSTQPAGTYVGQVLYTLVHPYDADAPTLPVACDAGKICYNPNGSDVVGTMGHQTIPTSGAIDEVYPTYATLLASNFSKSGYGFAGWSDVHDYATNPNAHFYGPQEYIEYTEGQYSGDNPGLALYAVWVKSAGSFQNSATATSVCSNLTQAGPNITRTLDSVSALTDERDNQTYAIAKLADGNCWMIENLRLEARDTQGNNRFNSSITNESLAQGYAKSTTYGNFSGLATAESSNFSSTTAANSLYYSGTQSGTASINIGTTDSPSDRMPRYNNLNTQNRATEPIKNTFSNDNTTGGMYSYGNYYTWSAAMANTLSYVGKYGADENGKYAHVVGTSLCPTGWRLPRGANDLNDKSFSNLSYKINGDSVNTGSLGIKNMRIFPNNFIESGQAVNSSINNRGNNGRYWTTTVSSTYQTSSYNLNLNNSRLEPGNNSGSKYIGMSIRCVIGP